MEFSLGKYLLSIYCVPSTVLGSRDRAMNKTIRVVAEFEPGEGRQPATK